MTSVQNSRVTDLIEAAATEAPDARALVVTADRVPITYRDLLRLADDLAAQLSGAGLAPGTGSPYGRAVTPSSSSRCWQRYGPA